LKFHRSVLDFGSKMHLELHNNTMHFSEKDFQ